MKKLYVTLVVFCLSIALVQCHDNAPDTAHRELTALEKQLVQSDNLFGFKLFRKINENQLNENIFISPLSVSMALGMTLNGARDSTFDAMRTTLEFNGLTQDQINRSYQSLIQLLKGLDKKVIFEIANSIWFRQEMQVEQAFTEDNRNYFDAEIAALDFDDPQSAGRINQWVSEKTRGKIDKIVEELNPETVMLLLNAIYFKGTWTYEFDKNDTHDDQFTAYGGASVPCKMMKQSGSFDYLSTDKWQALDLPYGSGDFSMTLLLPNTGVNINDVIGELNQGEWDRVIGQFNKTNGTVEIPKILLEYDLTMNDVLMALGMEVAFVDGAADFSGINQSIGKRLFISKVKHKTFVEVNEEGTEAAAVTSVEIGETSAGGSGFYFYADRPFLFFIRENRSQTILFMGKIVEP